MNVIVTLGDLGQLEPAVIGGLLTQLGWVCRDEIAVYPVEVVLGAFFGIRELVSIQDFRFHDIRHTWASWYRQAGTSCDELKELGGWKSRQMVDRYARYATKHLTVVAARIERLRHDEDGKESVTFLSRQKHERV